MIGSIELLLGVRMPLDGRGGVPVVLRMPLRYLLVHKEHVLLMQSRVETVIVVHEESPVIRSIPSSAVARRATSFAIFDLCRYSLALAVFLGVAYARIVIADPKILRIGLSTILPCSINSLL